MLNPPVIATLVSLALIFFGLQSIVPGFVIKPIRMIGDCTLPLAMFVVGGSLAQINIGKIHKRAASLMILAKLIILPVVGLGIIMSFKLPALISLLILIQLAMPPATSLSVITRKYEKEDLLISQGIFLGHLVSIFTLPVFLSLYFAFTVVK
jgi:predicted permease